MQGLQGHGRVCRDAKKPLGALTRPMARHAHLDNGHAHEPEQAPALLIVLLRHAHRALAVLGNVRFAAGLPARTEEGSHHSSDNG